MKNRSLVKYSLISLLVHFDTHFKFDTVENKLRISVPFVLDKKIGINTFMSSYDVGIENVTISFDKSTMLECPLINNVFSLIESENGVQYTRLVFYGDGEILPPGKYQAIKNISINVTDEMQEFCSKKIVNALVNEGVRIYFSNIYNKNPDSMELVGQIKYATQ